MTTMRIAVDDLTGPAIVGFLEEHAAEMRAVTPPGSDHTLGLAELRGPDVIVWSVFEDTMLVGCGAVKVLDAGHAEVKSMRTAPSHQRRGVASALLRHVVGEVRTMGVRRLSLETGSCAHFAPARRLYLHHGFVVCPPFGAYRADPESVFMTRAL